MKAGHQSPRGEIKHPVEPDGFEHSRATIHSIRRGNMYYISSSHLKDKKSAAYQKWLLSDEAKKLFAEVEKETGFKYVETFWPIMGLGEFGCEDWWEAPDWSSFDKARESDAMDRLITP